MFRESKYPDLDGLHPAQKDAERKRRRRDERKKDPQVLEEMKGKDRDNKRKQRLRKKQNVVDVGHEGVEPPQKRRRAGTTPAPSTSTRVASSSTHVLSALARVPSDPGRDLSLTRTPCVLLDSFIDPYLLSDVPHICDTLVKTETRNVHETPVTTVSLHTRAMSTAADHVNLPSLFSPPRDDLSPLPLAHSPASSNVIDMDLDLASDILGCQVPMESPTVKWSDGRTTILPCVLKDGVNVCASSDTEVVKYLAQLPESTPQSSHVIHLTRSDYRPEALRDLIHAALRDDKCVAIHEDNTREQHTLDADYLESEFGISPYMRVDIHG